MDYDKDAIQGLSGYGVVHLDIGILDWIYQMKPNRTLRIEAQSMRTRQDFGSWAMLLLEYTMAPHYFITVSDEYNYGNSHPEKRLHYYSATFGFLYEATRITFGYGRQRPGLVCIGGICRQIPAINGFTFSLSHTF